MYMYKYTYTHTYVSCMYTHTHARTHPHTHTRTSVAFSFCFCKCCISTLNTLHSWLYTCHIDVHVIAHNTYDYLFLLKFLDIFQCLCVTIVKIESINLQYMRTCVCMYYVNFLEGFVIVEMYFPSGLLIETLDNWIRKIRIT